MFQKTISFSVLFIPFGHLVIRFMASRFGNRGWWQETLDAISGTSMTEARGELSRWASLDQEPSNENV